MKRITQETLDQDFKTEAANMDRKMSAAGYRGVFQRIDSGQLGTTMYALWVSEGFQDYMMTITFTRPVPLTQYYKLKDCINGPQPKP